MVLRRVQPEQQSPTSLTTSPSRAMKGKQINLLRGWPSPMLLPSMMLGAGAGKVLNHSPPPPPRSLKYEDFLLHEKALLYGPDEGHLSLRESIGVW